MSLPNKSYKKRNELNKKYLKWKIKKEAVVTLYRTTNNTCENIHADHGEATQINFSTTEPPKDQSCVTDFNFCPTKLPLNNEKSSDSEITNKLLFWCVSNKITHSATNGLLKILREDLKIKFLPKDARTFLNTPAVLNYIDCPPGKYCHIGIAQGICYLLKNLHMCIEKTIFIDINIDGLPISKSSQSQFWPILGLIRNNIYGKILPPFVIGIYHGNFKPKTTSFMNTFVTEINFLIENGIEIDRIRYRIEIRSFICDAPARSFVTATAGHTALIGCSKCTIEGSYIDSRTCFPYHSLNTKRTNASFRQKFQEEFHKGDSPLELLPIDMVEQFPLDYLHLVCLGVTKKLLLHWIKGPLKWRLSKQSTDQISNLLLKASKTQPKEFNRRLRSLQYLGNFKGSEFRTFLLYAGPVVLKNHLHADAYKNFMCLHCGIRILCDSKTYMTLNSCADNLLKFFVQSFEMLYGKQYISYNVHNMIHLSSDSLRFGPLDEFSAFPFESFMNIIKTLGTRKGSFPLQQVGNRLAEIYSTDFNTEKYGNDNDICLKKPATTQPTTFKELLVGNITINSNYSNKWFKVISGDIVAFDHAINQQGEVIIFGKAIKKSTNYFEKPIKSSYLGIVASNEIMTEMSSWNVKELTCKLFAIKENITTTVFFPLLEKLNN